MVEPVKSQPFGPYVANVEDGYALLYEFRDVELSTKRPCLNWVLPADSERPDRNPRRFLESVKQAAYSAQDERLGRVGCLAAEGAGFVESGQPVRRP